MTELPAIKSHFERKLNIFEKANKCSFCALFANYHKILMMMSCLNECMFVSVCLIVGQLKNNGSEIWWGSSTLLSNLASLASFRVFILVEAIHVHLCYKICSLILFHSWLHAVHQRIVDTKNCITHQLMRLRNWSILMLFHELVFTEVITATSCL